MAFLGVFGAIGLGRFGYSSVLPDMQDDLGLSGAAAGSLASWNLAAYTLMALAGGFLAARFGPRRVVTAGMVVTAAGMLLTGLSDSLAAASATRFLTGIGNGMAFAPSLAVLAAWFSASQLGFASTVVSSATGLGLVVAGPVVPRLISGGGDSWRMAWYFFAAVTIVVAVLTFALQRNRPYLQYLAGTPRAPEARIGLSSMRTILRSGYAWHLGAVYLLYGFAYLIYFTFFQKRLTTDLGLSSKTAGELFLLAGITSLVCGVLWGVLSDRIGRGRTLAAVLGLQAVAAFLFSVRPGMAALVISAVVFGSGVFSVAGLTGAACGDCFGPTLAFASLGFVTVFIGLGQAMGPWIAGLLEDSFSSLGPSYLLAAGVFVVAAVAALLLPDRRSGHGSDPATRPPCSSA